VSLEFINFRLLATRKLLRNARDRVTFLMYYYLQVTLYEPTGPSEILPWIQKKQSIFG